MPIQITDYIPINRGGTPGTPGGITGEYYVETVQALRTGLGLYKIQNTEPASKFAGLMWKNTSVGTISGVTAGTTAVWNGTTWDSALSTTVTWGSIGGTLASQADLVAALAAKADKAANNFFSADQTISKANPRINFDKTASGEDASIVTYKGSILRWHVQFGNETAESGSNAGSDFVIHRFSDAGAYLGQAMQITRASGAMTLQNTLTASGRITSSYDFYATGAAAAFNFDDTAGGRYYTLAGNSGNVALFVNAATALVQFAHDRSTQYIYDSGAVARQIVHAGNVSSYVTSITESAETTVAAAGTATTWSHGLGVQPKSFGVRLLCKTAGAGYAVGDEIALGSYTAVEGRSIWASTSVVGTIVTASGGLVVPQKSNGVVVAIIAANWRYVFWAIK